MSSMGTTTGKADPSDLNSLVRGELAAVETYEQAIGKCEGNLCDELRAMRDEHKQHVGILTDRVRQLGGEPSTSSGTWGTFANTVAGAAKMIGTSTMLAALREGEEHGINDYETLLKKDTVQESDKELIRSRLLPRSRAHVAKLEQLIASNK